MGHWLSGTGKGKQQYSEEILSLMSATNFLRRVVWDRRQFYAVRGLRLTVRTNKQTMRLSNQQGTLLTACLFHGPACLDLTLIFRDRSNTAIRCQDAWMLF